MTFLYFTQVILVFAALRRQRWRSLSWVFAVMACTGWQSGCAHDRRWAQRLASDAPCPDGAIVVAGDRAWIDSGIDVRAGETLNVIAEGEIAVGMRNSVADAATTVGPEGTFFFADDVAQEQFPLPSAGRGPAPCYGLIGRVGDGPAFFIGRHKSWTSPHAGRLMLGINDFDVSDNSGRFFVTAETVKWELPVGFEQTISHASSTGQPVADAAVVVFYMDGLRPDVVREMAAMGHLPNIGTLFLDGGTWLQRTFTGFPSDTITSNGTMWTGCFSDRHGLKGQVRFSRRTLHSESYLEPLGPNRSARLLAPQGIDKLLQSVQSTTTRVTHGEAAAENWQRAQTSGVPPLYQHLRGRGRDWATGILPMMTEVPPVLWTRSLVRHLPYLQAHQAWQYIDDANTHYAVRHLLGRESPVTIIWLPETDTVSHKQSRGQFGMTRRTIARADLLIGRVVRELQRQGRLDRTYMMLVSDHGHHGGRDTHLSHFDLSNDLIFKPREMTADGKWVGGGWGLSVREHRFMNQHSDDSGSEFVFIDGQSDGAARIFLPRKHYRSRDWNGPARPADLLAYRFEEHLPPVDLVRSLTAAQSVDGSGRITQPIDLVILKLAENTVLISTGDRGQAVIERRRSADGDWIYKYTPVTDVHPAETGDIAFRENPEARTDPLRLLESFPRQLLERFHDERTWLNMTAQTEYPDGVVAIARHMLWQENLKHRQVEFAPDLVVTARPGWYFGHLGSPGTMHGYPLADSMTATWMIAGPNIRRGARVETPARLVDLTPTILEMVGIPSEKDQFDGAALRHIYVANDGEVSRPLYWAEVDLRAWDALPYRPAAVSDYLPISINRPETWFDANNLAYSVLTLSELNVVRLADDILFPLTPGDGPLAQLVRGVDDQLKQGGNTWIADAGDALQLSEIALADYSPTSLGNLKRVDGAVDWVQRRGRETSSMLARTFGSRDIPGEKLINGTVDLTQAGFWELYRFTQRVVVQVLDEIVINGLEDGTDRVLNSTLAIPAEVIVDD